MRVLILSCNTGGGHNACAGAVQEAFLQHGDSCDQEDSLKFVSEKLSRFLSWGHSTMYRHVPGLFRTGYGFAEKHPAMLQDDSAVYRLLTGGTEALYNHICQGEYDTVICTHVFSGLLLAQTIKEHPLSVRTAFVATDYTCSPGTATSELDRFFIPAASLAAEFISQGIPEEKLIPCGIPVQKRFYARPDKARAKASLGIEPDHTHLLLMCGSMGCGPMEKLAALLSQRLEKDMECTVVCGTNEKLYREMEEALGHCPNLHIRGFVKDMVQLMDSADLCLTKPGGLSTTEAAMKQLPMVLIDAVAGCEAHNLRYFLRSGGAVTGDTPEELCKLCLELMRDEARRTQMAAALASLPHENAAQCIRDRMYALQKAGGA